MISHIDLKLYRSTAVLQRTMMSWFCISLNRFLLINRKLSNLLGINEATNMSETALHCACKCANTEAAALFLKFGADLNARNYEGKKPFELLPISPSSEYTARVVIREAVTWGMRPTALWGVQTNGPTLREILTIWPKCREEVMRMTINLKSIIYKLSSKVLTFRSHW